MNNGWAWVLRDHEPTRRGHTKFFNEFDGAYLAACPACGQDCFWNAYDGLPMCVCANE